MIPLVLLLLIIALLLVGSAFFSSSEVAFFSLDPHQVHRIGERDPRAGERIAAMLARPTRLLSSILIGNTIVNIAVMKAGYDLAGRVLATRTEWLAILLITLVLLVVGEFIPKRIAMLWPEQVARLYAPTLTVMIRVLAPLRLGVERITSSFQHVFAPRGHLFSHEEYESLVDISGEEGVLGEREHSMMRGIIRLGKLYASDAMTPRVDVLGFDMSDSTEDLLAFAQSAKVRYVVLFREQLDTIEGLLDLHAFLLDPEHRIADATRKPFYVPELCTLDKLLTQFLTGHHKVAVVVDEYGGTAGLITRGDLLEEIVGELSDEYKEAHLFEELTPNAWMIDGNMNIEEVNQRCGLNLQADGSDRLSGWFTTQVERIPQVGDLVEGEGFQAMVRQMRRNRITMVLIEKEAGMSPQLLIGLLFVFLVGSAFFSGLETGVVSLHRLRLQHLVRRGVKAANILQRFLDRPDLLLGTTLIGTNLCNTAFAVLAASLAASMGGPVASKIVDFALTTLVVLLFGEYLPKAWFQSRPVRRSMRFAGLLHVFSLCFAPLTRFLEGLTNLLLPARYANREASYQLSRDELYHMMTHGAEDTEYLSEQKKQMIHEVYELNRTRCRDIMVPRDRMVIIEQHTAIADVLELARTRNLARFPVYSESADRFIGILNIFDLLEDGRASERALSDYIRPPQFVSEDLSAEELIPRIRLTRQPLLLVRNEQQEITGFITTEVVLAEIVGHLL